MIPLRGPYRDPSREGMLALAITCFMLAGALAWVLLSQ